MNRTYSLVVMANNDAILGRNLLVSDLVVNRQVDLQIKRNADSAALAYNLALDNSDADIVIFAHQDVYFPPGWLERLERAITQVERDDPDWALIGAIGMSLDARHVGEVWSTGQGAKIGQAVGAPEPVQSLDELVIVMRRGAAVRFDAALPGFHLYGTDIVQSALAAGKGAYVCKLPVVHNDRFHDRLRGDFAQAYQFVRLKWRANLPIRTTVLWVTAAGYGLTLYRLAAWLSLRKRRAASGDIETNSRKFSVYCGWE
jgi:glycosyltransferase involved in cell wall biosynthesis